MKAGAKVNPTVTVPVAEIKFINKAADLLGPTLMVMLAYPFENDDTPIVQLQWEEDVPDHVRERVEAAAGEVNAVLGPYEVLRVRGGDGKPLKLSVIA
jgi:hypothetical protein